MAAKSGARIIDPVLLTIVEFDATIQEQHTDAVEWTEFPVESGLPITDHGIVKPASLQLTAQLTDSPLRPGALPLPQLARRTYERLRELAAQRRLVTVVTGLRVYSSMGITSVDVARDRQTGAGLVPVVQLREIRIVNSVTVPVPPELLSPPVKASQQSAVDGGKQSPPQANARESTAALKVVQGFGGMEGSEQNFATLLGVGGATP